MDMAGITTGPRVNGQGNSVRFGGLAQRVAVKSCDIDSLILEVDPDWSTFLGVLPVLSNLPCGTWRT